MYGTQFLGNCVPAKSRSVPPALAGADDNKWILLCYEYIKYLFVEETSECNICSIFTEISNANNAVLYAVLHVSTVSILVTITAAQYVVFSDVKAF